MLFVESYMLNSPPMYLYSKNLGKFCAVEMATTTKTYCQMAGRWRSGWQMALYLSRFKSSTQSLRMCAILGTH